MFRKILFLSLDLTLVTEIFICVNARETETVKSNKVPYIELNNEVKMPQFGLGTFMLDDNNGEAYNAVLTALKSGYRHIDTAHAYGNERSVGRAIKDSGIPRDEIWVTSKLWPNEYGEGKTSEALERMLKRLGLEYIDLVYLHQPVGDVQGAWKDLVKAQKEGKIRAIGISNFDKDEKLFDSFMKTVEVKPQIMQLECHPYAQRKYWQKKLKENNIQQENWYPLGGRQSNGLILKDPVSKFKGENFKYDCPFLINNECSVYNYRGIICRSFGLMNISSAGKVKVPFCCFQGYNYANVMEDGENRISPRKIKKLGVKEIPLAFNTNYQFLTDSDFEKLFDFKFGDKKPLIDWFIDNKEKGNEQIDTDLQVS